MSSASELSRFRIVVAAVVAALVCLSASVPARADLIEGSISAVGTVQSDGVWDGYEWYRYTYTVEWSGFSRALSHLDLLQLPGCANLDHLFLFPSDVGLAPFDGLSTGEEWEPGDPVVFSVAYQGSFLRTGGDPSIPSELNPLALPVIKYEAIPGSMDEPGKNGVGVFIFICNVYPTYGTLTDFVLAKHNGNVAVGDLTGAYPSCTPTPEPMTAALVGLGLGGLIVSRRRRTGR
ncbi:MAG: PEP-CTERM sorting domain-containing protein [Phycisphaerae bacterium]|mgnify:CR=1 FL=1|nr:PEP-CTERM sorting domain-containing protein [Phycisphaerae bacterium]